MSDGLGAALAAEARALEAAAQRLVTGAPPPAADVRDTRELGDRLSEACGGADAETAALAAACADCLRGLEAGEIPLGPVLMYVASAAATLADSLAARAAGGAADPRALAAARHEIESFAPSAEARRAAAAPDVPVGSLRKRD